MKKLSLKSRLSITLSVLCIISLFLIKPFNQKAIYGTETLVEAKDIVHDKDNNPILIFQGPHSLLSQKVSPITEYEVKALGREKVWIQITNERYMPFVVFSMVIFVIAIVMVFVTLVDTRIPELIFWGITGISAIYSLFSGSGIF